MGLSILPFIAALSLLFPLSSAWAYYIQIAAPAPPPSQGEAVTLILELKGMEAKGGTLFYRPVGIGYYQTLPIDIGDGGVLNIALPPEVVVAPGIEYYVEVADTSGAVATSQSSPPALLPILGAPAEPTMRLLTPDMTAPVEGNILTILIEVKGAPRPLSGRWVTLLLDDTDITQMASFDNGRISYTTEIMPEAGGHTIYAIIEGSDGTVTRRSWSFTSAAGGSGGDARLSAYARGGLSFNYGKRIKSPSGVGSSVSANLNLSFGVEGEEWNATWSGININYIQDNPGDDIAINSGFYFTLERDDQLLEYGDITVRETSLTAPSLARRGLQAKFTAFNGEVHLFNVSTETVSGWDTGIGSADKALYGLSLTMPTLGGDAFPVTLVYISGKNGGGGSFNTGDTKGAREGEVVGLTLAHTLYGVKADGEVSFSRFDGDTTDGTGRTDDLAAILNISRSIGAYSLAVDYHYYGTDFGSIANPSFTADREDISGDIATYLGPHSITAAVSRGRDNVEDDPSRPVVSTTTGSLSWSFSTPPWPAMNLAYTRSVQESRDEPVGGQKVDNSNETIFGGLSMAGEQWSANVNGNYGKLTDRIGALDSDTTGVNLSASLTPVEDFNLRPSISLTESETGGVTKDSRILSLTLYAPIAPPFGRTSLQFSYTKSDASDGSQDSSTFNGSWRLSLSLNEVMKRWLHYGSGALALTTNYNRVDDNITPSKSTDETTVILSINLFAPIEWRRGF